MSEMSLKQLSQAFYLLLALAIVVDSEDTPVSFNFSPSYETDQPLMLETLNPWLMADGGLILRAVTKDVQGIPSLNWLRPNPSKCNPKPAVPACPSDRYCRIPEPPRKYVPDSKARPSVFYRDSDDYEENSISRAPRAVLSASSKKESNSLEYEEQKTQRERQQTDDKCLPYLSPGSYSYGNKSKDPSAIECICGHLEGEKRIDTLRKYHLHHCYHYSLWHVLSATMREGIAMSRPQCYANLEAIQRLDNLAAHFVCQFEDIVRRYDCGQTFSSKSSCQQCKNAYRQWVCSMIIPMWLDGIRVKPCRGFCHEVERLCPYFLPAEKTGPGSQYAGEPSFLCIDPDVRETTNQSLNSAYSERSCYRPCTLDFSLEPDVDPSLCVATLGDIPAYTDEETNTSDQTIGIIENCQQLYANRTDGGMYDNDDMDGDYGTEFVSQCKSLPTAPADASAISNSALKLLDYWTKVLPLTVLLVLLI